MLQMCGILVLVSMIIFPVVCFPQNIQPKRPADFHAYRYKHSAEDLYRQFSDNLRQQARSDWADLDSLNKIGRFKPVLDSLNRHEAPEWYKDAKLGIFFDWGLYSIAGFATQGWNRARYPDWYLMHMYHENRTYHEQVWGADFERDDFIGLFKAENFDAKALIRMAKKAGARYFVPFSKHHDGFCLWDSRYSLRDAMDMLPGRDIARDIVKACNESGLKHGFYFSVEEYEYPLIDEEGQLMMRLWEKDMAPKDVSVLEKDGEFLIDFIPEQYNRMVSGKIPVKDFIIDYIVPQAKDYIDRYDPDILWFDGEWKRPAAYYRAADIVAYFYNKAAGIREVVSNDRMGSGSRGRNGDFYTSETDEVVEAQTYPWEENRSMSGSYGFNWQDSAGNYLTASELIGMLVRIVAKGGNLNLIVNPDGSGQVNELQKKLLTELGAWLSVNGEAIYGTRPYEVICDNTQLGQPVWYTRSKDGTYAYAICLEWPKSGTFICPGANPVWETEVSMLGYDRPLEWVDTGKLWGLTAKIPQEMLTDRDRRPCRHAWVLKFKWDRENQY